MPLLSHNLAEELLREPKSEAEIFELGVGILRILRKLHEAGYVHADLKPANVMFDFDGRLSLVDFGLSHKVLLKGGVEQSGDVEFFKGDPFFCSLACARSMRATRRDDVESLLYVPAAAVGIELPWSKRSAVIDCKQLVKGYHVLQCLPESL